MRDRFDLGLNSGNEHGCAWIVITLLIALVGVAAAIAGIFILGNQVINFISGSEVSAHLAMSGLIHIVAGKYAAGVFYGLSGVKDNN